jgi:ADP-ribose pyrophosphatase YjhB (NUDIX family)
MAFALSTFRRLPVWLRRRVVRTITPSYVVGVVAVIRNAADEILLLRERHHEGWALPGGLLARGERPADGLVREIREEIGVRMSVNELGDPFVEVNPRARRVDVIYEVTATDDMHPRAQEPEVLEARWFTSEELPELFEPTIAVLEGAGVFAVHSEE